MANRGPSKGASFERQVAKALSHWVSKGTRDDLFWRSAASGGRATQTRKRGGRNETQVGDISSMAVEGNYVTEHFVLECKNYLDLQVLQSITTGRGHLSYFWRKLLAAARHVNREPLLIAHQGRQPTLLLTTDRGLKLLTGGSFRPRAVFFGLGGDRAAVHVCLFEELLEVPCPFS